MKTVGMSNTTKAPVYFSDDKQDVVSVTQIYGMSSMEVEFYFNGTKVAMPEITYPMYCSVIVDRDRQVAVMHCHSELCQAIK